MPYEFTSNDLRLPPIPDIDDSMYRDVIPYLRWLALLCVVTSLAGCGMFDRKKKEPAAATSADQPPAEPPMKDMSEDTSFQAFIGRLQKAVERRDFATLQSMMAPGFGYRWDTPPPEDNVFAYWDRNQLWNELALVLNEDFAAKGQYMVAPRAFADDPVNFRGFRAGMTLVSGSWKFAYFVGDEPHSQTATGPGQ